MATRNSRITERNEPRDPDVLASGDRLQSKEDDHMTNRLSPGVKFLQNLVTKNEEHVKKLFGEIEFDKFPSQHCNIVFLHVVVCGPHFKSADLWGIVSEVVSIVLSRIRGTH